MDRVTSTDGKWGAMDPSGKIIIPCLYEDAEPCDVEEVGYTFVCLNGRKGVINQDHEKYWED